jgi:hypothetical protein
MNMIPVKVVLVQMHNHYFGVAANQFHFTILQTLPGWAIKVIALALLQRSTFGRWLTDLANSACQWPSQSRNRLIHFINYAQATADEVAVFLKPSFLTTHIWALSLVSLPRSRSCSVTRSAVLGRLMDRPSSFSPEHFCESGIDMFTWSIPTTNGL